MIYYWSDLKPKTIKEETDFDWVNEPRNNPLDGLRLTTPMGRLGDGLTIKDDGGTYVTVISSNGSSEYHRGTVKNFIKMGIWLPKKDINESNDFDWVQRMILKMRILKLVMLLRWFILGLEVIPQVTIS
jgi:hypothetical protein